MAEKKKVPPVRVRSRGQISSTLERFAAAYKSQFPDRLTRYVYDPQHRPELSGVLGKQAAGFDLVHYHELNLDVPGANNEAVVRVGDLVLMSIDKETAAQIKLDNTVRASDELKRVSRKYREEMEQVAESVKTKSGNPGMKPVGSVDISMKEFTYDIEQRGEDG